LARRRRRIARPFFVRVRLKNPYWRTLRFFEGWYVRFMKYLQNWGTEDITSHRDQHKPKRIMIEGTAQTAEVLPKPAAEQRV
jgi:hypothetical protein